MSLGLQQIDHLNPEDPAEFLRQLNTTLQQIDNAFDSIVLERLFLKKQYAEPGYIEDEMIVSADGTTWDPGSGEGLYIRRASAWVKIA